MSMSSRNEALSITTGSEQPSGSSGYSWVVLLLAGALLPIVLAYSLSTGNEMQVAAAVVGLLGLLAVVARPFWGLIFFVALLYTRPEEMIPALAGMRLTLVISVSTLVGMLIQFALDREQFVRSPSNLTVLGFGAVTIFSTLVGGDMVTAVQDVGKLVILVLLVVNLARTPERYRSLITALLIFSCYLALFSIYRYFTGQTITQDNIERSQATGIFGDPNDLAEAICGGLALALPRAAANKGWLRYLYAGMAALFVTAIFYTNSRGGMLALLVVGGAFFLLLVPQKVIAAGCAAVLAFGLLTFGPSRMTTFDSTEASANQRFWYWDTGVKLLTERPLSGVGYSQFPEYNDGRTAHNSFVLCFAELGLPGYFFWIGTIFYCFRRHPKDADEELDPVMQWELQGARLAVVGFLVAGFFLSRTYVPVLYLLVSLPIAAQIAMRRKIRAFPLTAQQLMRDCGSIVLICIGSIIFIEAMAQHYK